MTDRVFFYGTLMTGFNRRKRTGIDSMLEWVGRGRIRAALFDLGIYPAAIPDPDGVVWGEVYRARDIDKVLAGLDEIEGYSPAMPEVSLYNRQQVPVVYEDGSTGEVWVYFYNAPLGRAERITSGDYLEYLKVK
jgi:gamma-glutamylcyclotransferase (GGCT)/AIG2-like uncharacterized protein YtfP